ncbi:hypothetical protein ACS0TY_033110 [Phlomoides rotata]
MLGKIGWKCFSNPNALITRIFKAKYFSRGNFLNANVGHSPSFAWRSIWSSQDVVSKGVRWRVGLDSQVRVWGMPWLNDDQSFYVDTPVVSGFEDLTVQDILVPETRMWDDVVISTCFAEDRRRILKTTVCPTAGADSLIWHFSDTGEYTVRSAYRMIANLTLNDADNKRDEWKKLWNLKIPPRVKHWFWRVCRDFLPTKVRLRQKHIPINSLCGLCGKDIESSWHLFMQCDIALSCWDLSGFREKLEGMVVHVESLSELFLRVFSELDKESVSSFLMVGWRIWKMRNDAVWEGKSSTAYRVVCDATVSLQEWLSARNFRNPAGQGRAPTAHGRPAAASGGMADDPGHAFAARGGSHSAAGSLSDVPDYSDAAVPGWPAAISSGKAAVPGGSSAATGGTYVAAGRSATWTEVRTSTSVGWSARGSSSKTCPLWHLPGVGVVKINVDAAIFF